MEKTLAIRIDDAIHRQIKIRLNEHGMSLKDYIISLILNDLKNKEPLNLKTIPVDDFISEDTIKEAQKILDFASRILVSQKT